MALTDYVIMPGADYEDACNAIRERDGSTGDIKSGELGPKIRALPTGSGGSGVPVKTCTLELQWATPEEVDGGTVRVCIPQYYAATGEFSVLYERISLDPGALSLNPGSDTEVFEDVPVGGLVAAYWEESDIPSRSENYGITMPVGIVRSYSSEDGTVMVGQVRTDCIIRIYMS